MTTADPVIDRTLTRFQEARANGRRFHRETIGDVDPERCFADWLCLVARAAQPGKEPSSLEAKKKLEEYSSVFKAVMNTDGGTVGGYLVPTDMREDLMTDVAEWAIIRSRATVVPMASKTLQLPLPDALTAQSAGTPPFFGGLKMSWPQDSQAITEADPTVRQVDLTAWVLAGAVVASNNLMRDGLGINAFLKRLFARSIAWHEDYAFLVGDGVAKPLGLLKGGGIKTVTRAGSNAVALADIGGMEAVLLPSSFQRAIWVLSPGAFGKVSQIATWYLNGPMVINGRPLFVSEKVPALGTQGDAMLVDPSLYVVGDRGELLIDASPEVNFLKNQLTWRVIERVDGRPWLERTVTLQDNATVVSPYVVLN